MSGSTHLRGIAIAGGLAALALALGYATLVMNRTASKAAPPPTILPLHARHTATAAKTAPTTAAKAKAAPKAKVMVKPKPKPKPKPVDPNLKAALAAGLPHPIAAALAAAPVAIVELTSDTDTVSEQAASEAQAGAQLSGAAFVKVDVDVDSSTVQTLARVLDNVPDAPAALIYTRPATLSLTLTGYVDQTVVEQAVMQVAPTLSTPAGQADVAGSWAAGANAACTKYQGQTSSLVSSASTDQSLTPAAGKQIETNAKALVATIEALPPPPGQAAEVRELDGVFAQALAVQKQVVDAVDKKDETAFKAALAKEETVVTQEAALERKLGATTCAGSA